MSCCGKKREQLRQTAQTHQKSKPVERKASQGEAERDTPAYFQYIGKTRLLVVGPKTRNRYRFDGPGAVVAVDPRDKLVLATVSALRQVRKPIDTAKEF